MHKTAQHQLQQQFNTASVQVYKVRLKLDSKCLPIHSESIARSFDKVLAAIKELEAYIYLD